MLRCWVRRSFIESSSLLGVCIFLVGFLYVLVTVGAVHRCTSRKIRSIYSCVFPSTQSSGRASRRWSLMMFSNRRVISPRMWRKSWRRCCICISYLYTVGVLQTVKVHTVWLRMWREFAKFYQGCLAGWVLLAIQQPMRIGETTKISNCAFRRLVAFICFYFKVCKCQADVYLDVYLDVQAMSNYGYEIVQTLIVDVEPDETVKRAMNEINAGNADRRVTVNACEVFQAMNVIMCPTFIITTSERTWGLIICMHTVFPF